MESQNAAGAQKQHRQGGGREDALPRTVLAELLKLPSARSFPLKRCRDAAVESGTAAAAAAYVVTGSCKSQLKPAADPTGLLLMEAASQLTSLVKHQLQRRMLRAARRGTFAASASDSEDDGEEEGAGGSAGSSLRGLHAASSNATASISTRSASAAPSLGGSMPESGPISLSRCKRICLERQFAIDFTGHCIMDGERVPLPAPDAAELQVGALPTPAPTAAH